MTGCTDIEEYELETSYTETFDRFMGEQQWLNGLY
jgi:hypothetical protein